MFDISELIKATGGLVRRKACISSITGVSIDSRSVKAGEVFIAIAGNNFDGHDFVAQVIGKGVGCVIVRRGYNVPDPGNAAVIEVEDTLQALGALARFNRRRYDIPVIAVTGSNGKTTTKDMLSWMLEGKYSVLRNEGTKNNHIGVPLTLLKLNGSHGCAVIEMGTNHFGEIPYLAGICEPTMAVITNIGPSHLEYFKDLKGVLKEKFSIMKYCTGPCAGILNADDRLLRKKLLSPKRKPFLTGFGINEQCDYRAGDIKRTKDGFSFTVGAGKKLYMSSPGYNNIYNALAAVSAARMLGLEYGMIASRLKSFVFPAGRLTVRRVGDIVFIDDTYNANPASMSLALDVLRSSKIPGRRVLVMGDMLELGAGTETFHRSAGLSAAGSCDIFIAVGKNSALAAEAAVQNGFSQDKIFKCESAVQAKDVLFGEVAVKSDDIVLLKGSRGMKLEQVLEPVAV